MRADVVAHIFDDTEDRHTRLLKHAEGLHRNAESHILRGRDDDGSGHRHLLRQRQMDVAGSRRKVHNEVVQITPLHIEQALLKRAMCHGAAPDQRLIGFHKQAHGHETNARRLLRDHAVIDALWRFVDPEHDRHRRTIDIAVEQADRRSLQRERCGDVDCNSGLPYAALAAADCDDILHAF